MLVPRVSRRSQVPNMTLDESDGEIRGSVTNEQGEVCRADGKSFLIDLNQKNTPKNKGVGDHL